jgi:CheY-like chemotaxis protein
MSKRILVADRADGDRRLSEILAGHEVTFARTMGEAQRLLEQRDFDLVMVGVHFDDSRMFDLLRHVRSAGSRHAERPLVCLRSQRFSAAAISMEGLEIAARALGCHLLLDLTRYPDDAHGNREARKLVDGVLTP